MDQPIHTDAIKSNLLPPEITPAQTGITYASEADLPHIAFFGQTAKQWRNSNSKLDGNRRYHATIEQLLVLANLESLNAEFIHTPLPSASRPIKLNGIAIRQMNTLTASTTRLLDP